MRDISTVPGAPKNALMTRPLRGGGIGPVFKGNKDFLAAI